jgi:hypothetical protein
MRKLLILISLVILSIITQNCGDTGVSSNRDVIFPDSNVSYIHQVEPFLSIKCSYQGCHSANDMAGNRDMSTYFALFDASNAGLVIANNPDASRMIQILKGNPQHSGYYSFPAGYFKDNYINGMVTWIKEGAKFN